MTLRDLLIIGGAFLFLLAFGVIRDWLRFSSVQVPPRTRPEPSEPVDFKAELRPIAKLPRRYPDTPWPDEDAA